MCIHSSAFNHSFLLISGAHFYYYCSLLIPSQISKDLKSTSSTLPPPLEKNEKAVKEKQWHHRINLKKWLSLPQDTSSKMCSESKRTASWLRAGKQSQRVFYNRQIYSFCILAHKINLNFQTPHQHATSLLAAYYQDVSSVLAAC